MRLNKKVLASLIAAGILTTGTALANPFDDVPRDHWAYDAVQTLADQGIVEGFNDNTYRGDKLMTRYEMAQIVARAMSKNKGAANPTLDKLSAEYADELTSLGVKVDNLEKKTAGVQDLKISHWMQMENSYGNIDRVNSGDKDYKQREYMLKYRLSAEKQVSPKLSLFHQFETKTDYYNMATSHDSDSHDGVISRLAYATYTPDSKTTVQFGKNAYWFAGGLLGDDYLEAVNFTTKLDNKTSLQLVSGRYWLKSAVTKGFTDKTHEGIETTETNQINYAGLNTKLGTVDLGAHYITGQYSVNNGQMNRVDLNTNAVDPNTSIWAVTAASDLGRTGINLSVGYGENTKEDNDNTITKVQLYKKIGKTDAFVQYWKEEANLNLPMENGDHMGFWGDQYSGVGMEGFRLIAVHPWSANSYSEFFYGDYKRLNTVANGANDQGKKYGFSLTFCY